MGRPQLVVRAAAAPFGHQLGHVAHAGEEGAGWFADTVAVALALAGGGRQQGQPLHEQFGAEEGEHAAGAGLGVQAVGKVGFYARAFPHKGQGAVPGGQGGGQAFGVAAALQFYAGQGCAFLFGFDYAAGFAVDVEQVVGKAVAGGSGETRESPRPRLRGCWRLQRCRRASPLLSAMHQWFAWPSPLASCVVLPAGHSSVASQK